MLSSKAYQHLAVHLNHERCCCLQAAAVAAAACSKRSRRRFVGDSGTGSEEIHTLGSQEGISIPEHYREDMDWQLQEEEHEQQVSCVLQTADAAWCSASPELASAAAIIECDS
jgi:hypothetical protein